MNNGRVDDDYLDRLADLLPWHRSLTLFERTVIIVIFAAFVSLLVCVFLCLCYPRSLLRRRYSSRKKIDKQEFLLITTPPRNDTRALSSPPLPPRYESVVNTQDIAVLHKERYLTLVRQPSYGGTSDSDDRSSANGKILRSQSTRSSLSNGGILPAHINTYPTPPFTQLHLALTIDPLKNTLIVHLTQLEHIASHPAFNDQAEYFVRVQLLNNKVLKKFHDMPRKRRSTVPWSTWEKQPEQTTKVLVRAADGTWTCDEYLPFEWNKPEMAFTSLRCLFFCTDRSGVHDYMFESVMRLNPSMIPSYEHTIEFKDPFQIAFGQLLLGIGYLPTSERFTIKVNELRHFCKPEKDDQIDACLVATFFHHGRRFFQKKLPAMVSIPPSSTTADVFEIKQTITQNIPANDIQSIHIHFELLVDVLHANSESRHFSSSLLLGRQTRYESEWVKVLEQPRQTHLGWYSLFG